MIACLWLYIATLTMSQTFNLFCIDFIPGNFSILNQNSLKYVHTSNKASESDNTSPFTTSFEQWELLEDVLNLPFHFHSTAYVTLLRILNLSQRISHPPFYSSVKPALFCKPKTIWPAFTQSLQAALLRVPRHDRVSSCICYMCRCGKSQDLLRHPLTLYITKL